MSISGWAPKGFGLGALAVFCGGLLISNGFAAAHKEGEKKKDKDHELIEKVMKEAHKNPKKGEKSIANRAASGESVTQDEIKTLIGFYLAMEKTKPPVGDKAEWKKRIEDLTKASIYLFAEKPGARDMYKEAVNCKACHRAHRPD